MDILQYADGTKQWMAMVNAVVKVPENKQEKKMLLHIASIYCQL
jgi:hypothetical protein